MSSGFRRVVVQVKAVQDLHEFSSKINLYVRTRLDFSTPLGNSDETAFATNVVSVSRKDPGPYTFLEESGDVNVFSLPDFIVVCDVMKVGGGCFNSGKDERIATLRIPLAKVELDQQGKSEMWYSLHYPAKIQSSKRGRYAGKLLVAITMEQKPPRTFQIDTYSSPSNKSTQDTSQGAIGAGTPTPFSGVAHFSTDSPPISTDSAKEAPAPQF
jgi:hypothetical protein